ncbi:hypothetical protein IAR55_002932 [Kwoniella newhampshirensis]|uniref:GSKIP domain-containing protein n=1 Tax=Kwoniella newhampshirensis TaxID=1651941 RepID=A0AAW0YQL5_9TREE
MTSSSSHLSNNNILLDPIPELRQAFTTNSFGLDSFAVNETDSFPRTKKEVEQVLKELRVSGGDVLGVEMEKKMEMELKMKIVGRGWVKLLGGEGEGVVRLDKGGWTLESSTGSLPPSKIGKTYESLETLLIDVSPAYVRAMNDEIWKRFEGHPALVPSEEEGSASLDADKGEGEDVDGDGVTGTGMRSEQGEKGR